MKITTVLTVLAAVLLVQAAPVPSVSSSSSSLGLKRSDNQASAYSLADNAASLDRHLSKRDGEEGQEGNSPTPGDMKKRDESNDAEPDSSDNNPEPDSSDNNPEPDSSDNVDEASTKSDDKSSKDDV